MFPFSCFIEICDLSYIHTQHYVSMQIVLNTISTRLCQSLLEYFKGVTQFHNVTFLSCAAYKTISTMCPLVFFILNLRGEP